LVGAILMICGGLALLGSLFLPWEQVDLQELFGADLPSISRNGLDTGIGKIAGVLAAAAVVTGVSVLALGTGRRRLPVALAGLGIGIGAAFVATIALLSDATSGTIVGLGGSALTLVGGILAGAPAQRGGPRS
jgi:hypothetical protein